MAFKLEIIYWGGTLDVSAGTTYGLEDMTGLGAASVRRLAERGPQQDGDTDLGYRTDPAILTLPHILKGTTDSHLDTLRDTLQQVYLPTADPLQVRVTRDDGEIRQIDAHRTGPLDLPLMRLQRPGHFARAVVQLKASDPVWYEPTAGTVGFGAPADWWLAFNTIGSANALEHVESPTQGQAWAFAGSVNAGTPWFAAIRSGLETTTGTSKFAWSAYNHLSSTRGFQARDTFGYEFSAGPAIQGTGIMSAGTHNYFFIHGTAEGYVYRDGVLVASRTITPSALHAGSARWRSNQDGDVASYWVEALSRAAFYDIAPTPTQIGALNTAMESGGTVISASLAYEGQWPEYPVVQINGPIADPILTNTTTGESLDFTGATIGTGDHYTIDTRYGRRTVVNSGGDNKIGELSSSSDLVSFHIAPPSEVSGGTNVFSLSGTATDGDTSALITYYNRYPSY